LKLGVVTDTWDLSGKILVEKKIENTDKDKVLNVLNKFKGKIKQVPPVYSSVKYKGRRSYSLAREGHQLKLSPKIVNIYNLELISINKDLIEIKINCSSGTYIRSLAYDIGGLLGTGASLKGLKRTLINDYKLEDSISVEEFIRDVLDSSSSIEKYSEIIPCPSYIVPLKRLLKKMGNIYVKDRYRDSIKNGWPVTGEMIEKGLACNINLFKEGSFIKVLAIDGKLLAVHEVVSKKIFSDINDATENMEGKKQKLTRCMVSFCDGLDKKN
jgi:tRNA pseudouridine55 synthase